jgi:hypothetical protein
VRTVSDSAAETTILRRLYDKPVGERVSSVQALKELCSPALNNIAEQHLIDIVAAPDGLLGHGLVACCALQGEGRVFAVANIELTNEGRTWVEERSVKSRLGRLGSWLCEHVVAELVSFAVGSVLGWLVRGWIPR